MILHVLIAMVAGWLQRHQQQILTYLLEESRVAATARQVELRERHARQGRGATRLHRQWAERWRRHAALRGGFIG